jgi:hypothetical protein
MELRGNLQRRVAVVLRHDQRLAVEGRAGAPVPAVPADFIRRIQEILAGFLEHRRAARKEMMLAVRSLLDAAIEKMDEKE